MKVNFTVLCYKKCSTRQEVLKWPNVNGISYVERSVREENPTLEELKEWYRISELSLKRFFNTSGSIYGEMLLKDKLPSMSEDEQLVLLVMDGMLVKRPLVVGDGLVLTGFKEAEWKEKLLQILTYTYSQLDMKYDMPEDAPCKQYVLPAFLNDIVSP